jgi:hypothetical protein
MPLVVAACAGDGKGDAPNVQHDSAAGNCPSNDDLTGPDVSFENDLMPFFSITCAFGGCHDRNTRQAGLYLGPNFLDEPADAAARGEVLASLLARSTTAPSTYRVVPFEPTQSFLMLKVKGCQNLAGLECGGAVRGKPCGDRMPAVSDELPAEKKSMLARWIARGAVGAANDGGRRTDPDGAAGTP